MLPAGIWALGFGSLFMDISSELIHSLLPVFMVTTLGASMLTVGIIEGIAEAAAAFMKVFSGALSDYLRRRKFLLVTGYALSALTKPLFPLADTLTWVFTGRFLDRIGKGIRGAPRDALVAEIAPPGRRGEAYGLRQTLDSIGAFIGPLAAIALMIVLAGDVRLVMWFAVIPAVVAVVLLVVFVREPARPSRQARAPLKVREVVHLGRRYWMVVLVGGVFTLARFSEAFLVLRAQDIGLALAYVPVVVIVMNVSYAALAWPAGAAADRLSQRALLLLGLAVLVAADGVLALASTAGAVLAGAALWGAHMALTQGLLAKLVADTSPPHLLATGFGFFNLISGVALLLASAIAGALWTYFGPELTFVAGATLAAVAALGLVMLVPDAGT